MQTFLPAPLLRSLDRFAARDVAKDTTGALCCSTLTCGLILGTQRFARLHQDDIAATQQVAVWGLLHLPSDDAHGQSFDKNLPGGVSRIGYLVIVCEDALEDELEAAALKAVDGQKKEEGIVLVYDQATRTPRMFQCKDGKATKMEVEVVQCLHARDFHSAIGYAPLRCAVDLHVVGDKSALLHQLEKYKDATRGTEDFYVRTGVTQGKKGRRFRVLNGRGEDVTSPETKPVLLSSILPEFNAREDVGGMKGKKKNGKKQKNVNKETKGRQEVKDDEKLGLLASLEYGDIASFDLLVSLAPMGDIAAAPIITIPTPSASKIPSRRFSAYCDVFVVVPVDTSVDAVLTLLREKLHYQLSTVYSQLKDASEAVSSVAMHQFPLVGAAFPLTVVSSSTGPDFSSNECMEDAQMLESLHRAFLQPLNQPLFRVSRGCSLAQQAKWLAASDVLFNVHEGIPSHGGGSQCQSALVDGFYGYYHYLQQGVNDKGWGCAYRSLQTLSSWLFMQHYTQQRFLSHEQIQSALVKMGDKPARFQGSTEWIGSLEVGYVLDELFGVTFRSLSVSSGAQLPDVARELIYHFETQGTPVMMGGGQLAFTLLGVTYDPDAGICALLTLDPHYTGDEDLATIQNQTVALEGYKAVPCSWRKTSTFARNSFYNLCLPQRPSVGF